MYRFAILLAALALAGCAASQLHKDLAAAETPCHKQNFADKTALAQCLTNVERPVWARDEPRTLDIYDRFASGRAALARERDAGKITERQYEDRLHSLADELRGEADSRRGSSD